MKDSLKIEPNDRILIVDDDKEDIVRFINFFNTEPFPFKYLFASSIDQARKSLKNGNFCAAVLDYQLSDGTIFELISEFNSIPSVILINMNQNDIVEKILNDGIHEYLAKDNDGNYLLLLPLLIKKVIRLNKNRLELAEYQKQLEPAKKSMSELKNDLQFMTNVLTSVNEGIIVVDSEMCCSVWNSFMENLTGLSTGEIIGKNLSEILSCFCEVSINHMLKLALDGEIVNTGDVKFHISQTENTGWINVIFSPFRNETNQIEGVIGIIRDVTNNHRYEPQKYLSTCTQDQSDLICHIKPTGIIDFSSESFTNLFGKKNTNLTGVSLFTLVDKASGDKLKASFNEISSKKPFNNLILNILQGEQKLSLFWRNSGIFDDQGKPGLYHCTATDISEQIDFEEALFDQNHLFEEVFSGVLEGIGIVDESEMIIFCNNAFANILEINLTDLIGKNILSLFDDAVKNIIISETGNRKSGKATMYELPYVSPAGNKKHLLVSVSPRKNSDGSYAGGFGTLQDITQRKIAEENLREREELFRAIVENAAIGIMMTDTDGKIVKSNESLNKMLGYSEASFMKMKIMDLTYTADLKKEQELFLKLIENKIKKYNIEKRLNRKDGSIVWCSFTLSSVTDTEGNSKFLVGLVEDITERRNADNEIRKLLQAVEQSPASIVITNTKGSIEYVNPKFCQVTGYTFKEAFGKNPRMIKSGEKPPEEYAELWQTLIKGKVWRGEFHNKRKNGELFWEFASISPIRNAEGQISHFLAVKEDITERKLAEDIMKKRNNELELLYKASQALSSTLDLNEILRILLEHVRIILNVTATSIWVIDPDSGELVCRQSSGPHDRDIMIGWRLSPGVGFAGWVVDHNRSLIIKDVQADSRHFTKIDEKTGLDLRSILAIPLRVKSNVVGVLQVVDSKLDRFSIEEQKLMESLAASASIAIENADLFLRAQTEINVRKKVQQELVDLNEKLELKVQERTQELNEALQQEKELHELKSRFITMASHEFRTPLTTILSSASLLKNYYYKMPEEKKLAHLEKIQNAVDRMTRILEDVLTIGKSDAGKIKVELTLINMKEICQNIISEFEFVDQNKHYITFSCPPEKDVIVSDQHLFEQIIINLISNAIKYSAESSSIMVEIEQINNQTVITVGDQGIGIPEDDMKNLFENFHRATNVGTIEGTGLGLSIVKQSVKLLNGDIEVMSKLNQGTTFRISLPALILTNESSTHF